MTGAPPISVVMPVLNSARFLPEALASIAAQTHAPAEVILVDGPSTDATADIARAFPGARYLRQRGTGMWNALNEGIAAARGELIALLSDDDLWTADKLAVQVDALCRQPELEYVSGLVRFVRIEGEPLPPAFRPELLDGEHAGFLPEALLIRAALFSRIGDFDETHRIAADIDWLTRARAAGAPAAIVPRLVLYKRVHADNLSTRASSAAIIRSELLQIVRRNLAARQRSK